MHFENSVDFKILHVDSWPSLSFSVTVFDTWCVRPPVQDVHIFSKVCFTIMFFQYSASFSVSCILSAEVRIVLIRCSYTTYLLQFWIIILRCLYTDHLLHFCIFVYSRSLWLGRVRANYSCSELSFDINVCWFELCFHVCLVCFQFIHMSCCKFLSHYFVVCTWMLYFSNT